jgi:hypothetical protein
MLQQARAAPTAQWAESVQVLELVLWMTSPSEGGTNSATSGTGAHTTILLTTCRFGLLLLSC